MNAAAVVRWGRVGKHMSLASRDSFAARTVALSYVGTIGRIASTSRCVNNATSADAGVSAL